MVAKRSLVMTVWSSGRTITWLFYLMKKFSDLGDAQRPQTYNALPDLHYPSHLNAAQILIEGALQRGWGSRPAFHHKGGTLTFQQVADQCYRYAHALRVAGVAPGDRVLIRLHDSPELIFVLLASFALGAIAVPTYVQLKSGDFGYRLRDSGATLAIVGADLLDVFEAGASAEIDRSRVLVVGGSPGRFSSLEGLMRGEVPQRSYHRTEADDVAIIVYTSGSTGEPKGTVHSHRDLLAICDSYCGYCVKPSQDDVIAGPPSIPFSLALGFMFLFPMRFGASAYLDRDKSVESLVDVLERHKVSILVAVPAYYNRLLRYLRQDNLRYQSLRLTLCGGEPLSHELERAWFAHTRLPIIQFLGTTEMLHIFVAIRAGEDEIRAGAIGRAVPGYEVRVLDTETLKQVTPGGKGLLAVRGPTGTHYRNKGEQQRNTVKDGWNVFQDVVWCDEDGYIHYVVRNDDMIISGGHNIAPVEVENILLRHPHVLECACIGIPDHRGDRSSIVKAFVALRPSVAAGEDKKREIQDFFKREGPPYMYPREIEFVESLPKTLSGKVLRAELKKRAG